MTDFEKKSEEKELNPEGSPHPEIDKEKEMLAANLLEKKPILEKPIKETTTPSLKIERWEDGQLRVYKNGNPVIVKPARCFPWTQPSRYISLRDEEDNEIALVTRLDELDKKSREYLEQVLVEVGFVLVVEEILDLDEDFEIRTWKVKTKQGIRSFQTKLDEWPRPVPGGGLLIRDVAGDLFYIPNPKSLDAKSKKMLWAFLDES